MGIQRRNLVGLLSVELDLVLVIAELAGLVPDPDLDFLGLELEAD